MLDNLVLFFDGCHKIYYAHKNDTATIQEMEGYGYVTVAHDFEKELDDAWYDACPLRFISPANLDTSLPHLPQFSDTLYPEFKQVLSRHLT